MELFRDNFVNAEEQIKPLKASVTGDIPKWLTGSFLRVGPGKFDIGDFTLNHWFDGLAIVYKFHFEEGQVTFRKKFLESDAYRKACVAQRPVFTEFGTRSYPDPCKNIFSRMYSKFDPGAMTDNTSSNIMFIEDEVFVATESCFLRKVDPRNLETGEKVDLMKLVGVNMATSHPLTDKDGTTYNLGGSFISGPKYHIIQVPPCKDTNCNGSDPWTASKVIGTIPSSWKTCFSYHHSFGMTENYLIFLEQPMLINTVKIATSQVKGKSLHDCLDWCPEEKVKFHIINKTTGQLLKTKYISEEAFFLFHHSNAYEVDGQIVVDVVAYDSPEIFDKLYLNKVRMNEYSNRHPPQLRRFVIPIVEGKTVRAGEELVHVPGCEASAIRVKDNRLGDHIRLQCQNIGKPGFEMPSHNPKYTGKHYRYVYGTGGYEQGYFCHSASKTDVETGESWLWKGNEYQYPGEPVFVARPDSTDEDDGVLLVTVVDIRKDHKDMMLVLDAKDLSEIARAEVDVPIPNGLHGLFRLEE